MAVGLIGVQQGSETAKELIDNAKDEAKSAASSVLDGTLTRPIARLLALTKLGWLARGDG